MQSLRSVPAIVVFVAGLALGALSYATLVGRQPACDAPAGGASDDSQARRWDFAGYYLPDTDEETTALSLGINGRYMWLTVDPAILGSDVQPHSRQEAAGRWMLSGGNLLLRPYAEGGETTSPIVVPVRGDTLDLPQDSRIPYDGSVEVQKW